MARINTFTERVIAASPEQVYATLIDYRGHHPRILPPAFADYAVESGAMGEGTIFTTTVRSGGRSFPFRMRVSVPEPGRVIEERDFEGNRRTRFTIKPEGTGTHLRIESWWSSPGLMGWLESLVAPGVTRKIFAEEIGNIEAYASRLNVEQDGAAVSTPPHATS